MSDPTGSIRLVETPADEKQDKKVTPPLEAERE
jgi:hypothetical protein